MSSTVNGFCGSRKWTPFKTYTSINLYLHKSLYMNLIIWKPTSLRIYTYMDLYIRLGYPSACGAQLILFSYMIDVLRPQVRVACRLSTRSGRRHKKQHLTLPQVPVNHMCLWLNIKISSLTPEFKLSINLSWFKWNPYIWTFWNRRCWP